MLFLPTKFIQKNTYLFTQINTNTFLHSYLNLSCQANTTLPSTTKTVGLKGKHCWQE